jgi:DedD protein
MAKQIMDDEINLKRRARRRLIGAVALVIVVVVLLPMVLDSEPKLAGQSIELRIPDKNKVGEFAPGMDISSVPVAVSAAVSAPIIADQVATASQVVESKPVPASSGTKPVSGTSTEDKRPASRPGFVVQVGAFANADTAHQLQKKLSNQNIKVYTEKVDGKIRVRAGPYDTREAADSVNKKLEAQGLKSTVSQAY